ncbi:transcriptional regulator [Dendronalium phyllosphericum]
MTKTTGKMTLTFNSEFYSQLLSEYQPRIIKTEDDNERFLEIVEELLSHPKLSPEENALLELLVKLIEDFEDKHYQLNSSTPHSRILHLMEAQDLTQNDLVEILGSNEVVDKVINGHLELNKKQAEALAKLFNVDASLFTIE